MHQRKNKDNNNEQRSCQLQREKGTIIFPAIEITNEIEKIEDTTCIDTNRDELLKSFCSFRCRWFFNKYVSSVRSCAVLA